MTGYPNRRQRTLVARLQPVVHAALLLMPAYAPAQDPALNGAGIWSIADTPGMSRWIVIHDPGTTQTKDIYHIEVIGRETGAPAWRVVRLVPHMAITERALRDSIVEPLQGGAVYPESFDDAYAAWRAQNGGAGGSVCTSTVIECMLDGRSDVK